MRKRDYREMIGKVFHRLTVQQVLFNHFDSVTAFQCSCFCGSSKIARAQDILSERTKSCGCLQRETSAKNARVIHGATKTSEYRCWKGLKERCLKPYCKGYKNYGGRGLKIAKRWSKSFNNFLQDMGPRPSEFHTLERKNNNRGYIAKKFGVSRGCIHGIDDGRSWVSA